MNAAMTVMEIILLLLVPFLILRLRKSKTVSLVGTAGCAYAAGIAYAVIADALASGGAIPARNADIAEISAYVGIALAIPLLLFSNDFRSVRKLSKEVIRAFGLLVVSVCVSSAVLFLVFTKKLEDGAVLSGMAAALYTGGTPNLNAVAAVFGLDRDVLLAANLSDILFGGVFYAFLIFCSKPLVTKVLKSSDGKGYEYAGKLFFDDIGAEFRIDGKLLRNFGLSLASVIVSAGAGLLFWVLGGSKDGTLTNCLVPALMVGTTVCGLALSFVPSVKSVEGNYIAGQYFAAIFSFAISSLINFKNISAISADIFLVFAILTTASFVLHLVLCRIFGIHAEVMIVTSTSGIYGPAFVPNICRAIKADSLLASGLITGALGYAVGTFLGIGFVYFLSIL